MVPTQFISKENFRYIPVETRTLHDEAERFKKNFDKFLKLFQQEYPGYPVDFNINYPMIYRITERIDQRRDYYLYFHSNDTHAMVMSQAKETALFCYWFIKYKPVSFIDPEVGFRFFNDYGYTVNEYYATFLLMSFAVGLDRNNFKFFRGSAVPTLTYSLANREISKEALILYAESFLTDKSAKRNHNV